MSLRTPEDRLREKLKGSRFRSLDERPKLDGYFDPDWFPRCPECQCRPMVWAFDNGALAQCDCQKRYEPPAAYVEGPIQHHCGGGYSGEEVRRTPYTLRPLGDAWRFFLARREKVNLYNEGDREAFEAWLAAEVSA